MRTKVIIVRSTPKAHLVKDDQGRECWIQQRWLKEDQTVSSKTFERGVESKAKFDSERATFKQAASDFRNNRHPIQILGESASGKAVAVQAVFSDGYGVNEDITKRVWLPKSQVVNGAAPGWLLEAKARELGEGFIGGQNHFSIVVHSIGGVELEQKVTPSNWN